MLARAKDHAYALMRFVVKHAWQAVGNSPMANIMRDGLAASRDPMADRPRIVGLTASFVSGKTDNLVSKRQTLEALLCAQMWAPSTNLEAERKLEWRRVEGWATPQNRDSLEQWAKDRVDELLRPLATALAPIKKTGKTANDAAHVLGELGMRACVFYLEYGLFPELEDKAAELLKGGLSVFRPSVFLWLTVCPTLHPAACALDLAS